MPPSSVTIGYMATYVSRLNCVTEKENPRQSFEIDWKTLFHIMTICPYDFHARKRESSPTFPPLPERTGSGPQGVTEAT